MNCATLGNLRKRIAKNTGLIRSDPYFFVFKHKELPAYWTAPMITHLKSFWCDNADYGFAGRQIAIATHVNSAKARAFTAGS